MHLFIALAIMYSCVLSTYGLFDVSSSKISIFELVCVNIPVKIVWCHRYIIAKKKHTTRVTWYCREYFGIRIHVCRHMDLLCPSDPITIAMTWNFPRINVSDHDMGALGVDQL